MRIAIEMPFVYLSGAFFILSAFLAVSGRFWPFLAVSDRFWPRDRLPTTHSGTKSLAAEAVLIFNQQFSLGNQDS